MLTMKTFTRGQVRFEWADEEVESVVSVSPQDDQETIVRKLKRVLALVEGEPEPRSPFLAGWTKQVTAPESTFPPGNGWAAMAAPELPDRLQGEVELIQPGEEE